MNIYPILNNKNYLNSRSHLLKHSQNLISEQKSDVKYGNYSTDNLKANYMINFKGTIVGEDSSASGIGILNHETHFFREPKTDETVQNYVLDNFSDDEEINIVSGACSTGEEAKSYAMMLSILGNKLHISGFDISEDVVQKAGSDTVNLLIDSDEKGVTSSDSEKFIIKDGEFLTPYMQKCKQKFMRYYDKCGSTYKVPIYPEMQKQLDDLKATMQDKEKWEKAKNEYDESFNRVKEQTKNLDVKNMSEILSYMPSFEESMQTSMKIMEQKSKMCYTFQNFKEKRNFFNNCDFRQGNLLDLGNLYEPNSINVLLYRNALYHTLCQGNSIFRFMGDDSQDKMNDIAKQMNKVVKPQGLVVFGEEEDTQGVDTNVVKMSMENNGFKKLVENGEEKDNIWVKVSNID